MLTIREDQMKKLRAYMVEGFVDRTVAHLRAEGAESTEEMTDDQLRDLVHEGIETARKYSLTTESQIQAYVDCMAGLGRDFDTNPDTEWAGEILRDSELGPNQKIEAIEDYLLELEDED